MGCGASADTPEEPPPAPEEPLPDLVASADAEQLTVFDPRFVVPPGNTCVLHLHRRVLSPGGDEDVHTIADVAGGTLSFQVTDCKGDSAPKVISDDKGAPLFKLTSYGPKTQIQAYDSSGKLQGKYLFKVSAESSGKGADTVTTEEAALELKNSKGEEIELSGKIVISGSDKMATFPSVRGGLWFGGPRMAHVSQPAIARVSHTKEGSAVRTSFPDAGLYETSHAIEIAPGVDAALVVATFFACIECHFSATRGYLL